MDEKRMGELKQLSEKLYESLPPDEFSIEALAKCLKPYYEETSEEELIEKLKSLQTGMEYGAKIFGDMYETYVESCEKLDAQKLVREKADEELKGIPEDKQRDILCKMLECLCEGKAHDDLSAMSLDKLKDEVCAMAYNTSRAEFLKSIREAKDAKQSAQSDEFKEQREKFSEEERSLIDAAAAYTLMHNHADLDAEKVGEQFAVQQSAVRYMTENKTINTALKIISVLSVLAATFAVGCAIYALYRLGAMTFLVFPIIIFLSLPEVMPDLIEGYFDLPEDLYKWLKEREFVKRRLYENYSDTTESLQEKERNPIGQDMTRCKLSVSA